LASCATESATAPAPARIAPVKPAKPAMERVVFEDAAGGLWLSWESYRAMERNIIAMREYEGKLEAVIEFYEGVSDAH
jgi:hypothetical protein